MADWDRHIEISRSFRDQGVVEIESGDLLQGSEKLWGAAAHAIKAVAERRGWEHASHRHLFSIVNRLASETGDYSIAVAFAKESELHVNFYEGHMEIEEVNDMVEVVVGLLDALEGLNHLGGRS